MRTTVSTLIAALALGLSLLNAWLTLLRPGRLRMTQPTLLYFGPDGGTDSKPGGPKVFLRTLLHSSSRRGNLIENMYVTLRRGETAQNFSVWVYRDRGVLSRGSGLYVGHEGLTMDHHFLLPHDGTQYAFKAGSYTVDVYAKLARRRQPTRLGSIPIDLPEAVADAATTHRHGVFFDWGPDLGHYQAHARPEPAAPVDAPALLSSVIASELLAAFDTDLQGRPAVP